MADSHLAESYYSQYEAEFASDQSSSEEEQGSSSTDEDEGDSSEEDATLVKPQQSLEAIIHAMKNALSAIGK
ncbi:hypothetical protein Ciccas_001730 [Cichlidogyrus casuarinus]|uniref:Uncharacterized protein n=1 Tax=Cichlidogyrus casuarinus TaxID=1844966 RepID=A0ABD2QJ87_9PLAT